MPIVNTDNQIQVAEEHKSYILPLALVTSLFFLWGLAYGLLDVLNKHFQETLGITKQRSTLLQVAYFGAYFLMAIPAGVFMSRTTYKNGIILGLLLYALGAFLFYPAATNASFSFFLLAIFILASGLTFLETAANPYVTILGRQETSAFRLNLSQSFNGIGSFIGPLIGAQLFFASTGPTQSLDSVQTVYIAIAIIVTIIAGIFFATRMPEVSASSSNKTPAVSELFLHRNFNWAVATQFFYVAAQVGIAALFINCCTEKNLGIDNEKASYLLSASLLLFTIGRFVGTFLMKFIQPTVLLSIYAVMNMLLSIGVVFLAGMLSIYSLMGLFFFASVMFPTIFALGVKGLGENTKHGSSGIIMSIVGGAVGPYVMGSFNSTADAYIVPFFCFAVVLFFGLNGHKSNWHE